MKNVPFARGTVYLKHSRELRRSVSLAGDRVCCHHELEPVGCQVPVWVCPAQRLGVRGYRSRSRRMA